MIDTIINILDDDAIEQAAFMLSALCCFFLTTGCSCASVWLLRSGSDNHAVDGVFASRKLVRPVQFKPKAGA